MVGQGLDGGDEMHGVTEGGLLRWEGAGGSQVLFHLQYEQLLLISTRLCAQHSLNSLPDNNSSNLTLAVEELTKESSIIDHFSQIDNALHCNATLNPKQHIVSTLYPKRKSFGSRIGYSHEAVSKE